MINDSDALGLKVWDIPSGKEQKLADTLAEKI